MTDPRPGNLPQPEAVAAALERLEPWIIARGFTDRLPLWLAKSANPARALANLEGLLAEGHEPEAALLEPLLCALGGSQTLASVLVSVPGAGLDWFGEALAIERVPPAAHVAEMKAAAASAAPGADPFASPEVGAILRRHKRRHVLRIGARDLLGLASVDETVREISSLAEGTIEVATRHARGRVAGEFGDFAPQPRLRFVVLAMGKLGGGELNFSSDIDLVYLFDGGGSGSAGGPRGSLPPHGFAARVSEIVTRLLSEKTADGFVFRVDLRLRPDGQNGPIVNSLAAALTYYESWGQTWERAAMIKARPVAGDFDLGEEFLRELRPFVYRRYLDFASIDEIHEMKARVWREHSRARLERDVKLGPGGIREIEFIVQVLQLVNAGRDDRLRVRPTLEALAAAAKVGLMRADDAEALAAAYRFLRDVEHKIQIVHERQTHLLPDDPEEERFLARRLGFHLAPEAGEEAPEVRRLRAELERHRAVVRRSFERLFSGAAEARRRQVDDEVVALLQGVDDRERTVERLRGMGFADPLAATANLRLLRDGPSYSPASPRRRKALLELAPALFTEIRRSSDPDLALHQMAQFISAIGARTSFLVLLAQNPETLRLLVGLFGASQYLSSFFLRHPELLDSLVRADLAVVRKDRRSMGIDLTSLLDAAGGDYEAELDALRRFRNEEFLRIGVNDIHGLLEFGDVSEELSDLAEVCIAASLEIAREPVEQRFGPPPGRFAVIGMGKLGARELNYNSDLDLIFVYAPAHAVAAEKISVHEYFTRLAQRLISVLQVTTREGHVYKIDTRLRPSGSAGPLVSSMDGFRRYHETSSALWERQALIRARGVVGDASLIAEVETVIEGFVYGREIGAADVAEIARLRARMERELARESAERWNVKTGRGGIVDIEFMTQMLQLRHGRDHPAVRLRPTERALEALHREGLIAGEDHRALEEGYRFLRRIENRLRIDRDQPVEALEHAAAAGLARRLGYGGTPDSAARELLADLERTREAVRRIYERHFGPQR